MSALVPIPPGAAPELHDQFVVSFGKSSALGVFTAAESMHLRRGCAVIVQTDRGVEIGAVLGPASLLQARLLGATSSGVLLRRVNPADETMREKRADLAQQIFDTSRTWAQRDGLSLEILDVDLMFDGSQAIVQFVGDETATEPFVLALETHFKITVRLENLAGAKEEHDHGGCDKPDCGRQAGGGCSTCSTGGGGCSTCGSGKTDLREYFGHLRTQMESRIPLA